MEKRAKTQLQREFGKGKVAFAALPSLHQPCIGRRIDSINSVLTMAERFLDAH